MKCDHCGRPVRWSAYERRYLHDDGGTEFWCRGIPSSSFARKGATMATFRGSEYAEVVA